jgi:SAM-dependent methyltransferase
MRENVRAFIAAAASTLAPRGPVYEFGSYQVEGQRGRGDLRGLFPGRNYVGCDMRPGKGVDRIEDLAQVNLPSETAGTIICADTLEHVFEVRRAAAEMIRLLQPGGMLLVAVPLDFHIHAHPDDYWRLTPSCIARLLSPLAATLVGSQGVESYPHTVFGIGWKAPVPSRLIDRVETFHEALDRRLGELSASVFHGKRWKHWLRGWAGSKGERRRRREHFSTRFSLHMTAEAPWPSFTPADELLLSTPDLTS